ncbi:threonylcarbamoyl-AMP synthase [Bacillaceae bacterium SIJ1]|uniref:L-threonylcarbamoyladenylate synthase n=1 Tax=Litoribacterium kuwaitense TaxID=1398745 RepID=UPI0013EA875C|nr:L-threonylcarbamoyladenylate synthase [Litoribacterium kuwaitense]NGP44723.1 threonylcarbamoyl-AMP synthase [Litoribacterium kuwaitense]
MNLLKTAFWSVENDVDSEESVQKIKEAAEVIRQGGVVAFPTETVYGLGASAFKNDACQRIFAAKGRPADNPLIVHICSEKQLYELSADLPSYAFPIIEAFWPGPLSLVVPDAGAAASSVTAGLDSVAVRMPDHPVALALIEQAGLPLAAPSANRSGRPSPTTAQHVWNDLCGRIHGIVDGGPTGIGVESTVVDCTQSRPVILRPGGISQEDLEAVAGPVDIDPAVQNDTEPPRSPGLKYQHYAPEADLLLVDRASQSLAEAVRYFQAQEKKVGVLLFAHDEEVHTLADYAKLCSDRYNAAQAAKHLFASLRSFDEAGVDIILSETLEPKGIGAAVMNRLVKAAGRQWYTTPR